MRSSDVESPSFHPLMARIGQPMSRRAVLLGATGLVAMHRLEAAAARQTPMPDVEISGAPDAVELLEQSAAELADLETFTFRMETVRGSSTLMQGFELESVTGAVRRPMDLQAEVEVSLPLGTFTIGAIALDGEFWIEDPLSGGEWMALGSVGEVQTIINPDFLIRLAISQIDNATVLGGGKVDGIDATIVEGEVDFSGIAEEFEDVAGNQEMGSLLAEEPVIVTFWIDEEHRVLEVEMLGPILASESDDLVRRISLRDFNHPVLIEPPETAATPEG